MTSPASAGFIRFGSAFGIVCLAGMACAPAREPLRLELPGPARAGATRDADVGRKNAECEQCHAEIAAEWRSSLHHQSYSNASFQAAFEREPLAFCQGCHAPEADPRTVVPVELAELGVSCTSCHSTPEGVLAGPSEGRPERAPHPVVRLSREERNSACAGCHEFAFPDALVRGRTELMQATLTEHRRSVGAATPCVDCHMPRGPEEHREHGFHVAQDPAFLRRAVTITAERTGPRGARLSLRPAWLGHAFPTGDLFRRLVVSAEAVGPDYQLLGTDERYLTRHFLRKRGNGGFEVLELVHDDRVGLDFSRTSVVELDLGAQAENAPIAWRVSYQRVAHPRGVDEREAVVEADVEIEAGVLPAITSSPNR